MERGRDGEEAAHSLVPKRRGAEGEASAERGTPEVGQWWGGDPKTPPWDLRSRQEGEQEDCQHSFILDQSREASAQRGHAWPLLTARELLLVTYATSEKEQKEDPYRHHSKCAKRKRRGQVQCPAERGRRAWTRKVLWHKLEVHRPATGRPHAAEKRELCKGKCLQLGGLEALFS